MAKTRKTKRSRFDGIDLNTLNKEAAKVTGQQSKVEEVKEPTKKAAAKEEEVPKETVKKGRGRPKTSNRKPLNTAIDPKNRQRLEFLAMLNGGSVADQLNQILERYFTEVEKVDELIDVFEARKKKLSK